MAIKLNGVEITSNKLNGSNVTLENLDGVKVWPTGTPTLQWQFVGSFSSTPYNYDVFTVQNINSDYKQGLYYLNTNYPVIEFDNVTVGEYNQADYKFDVTVPEGAGAEDVMYAFITQHNPRYVEYVVDAGSVSWKNTVNNLAVRADDGHGYSYWILITAGDYYEGFVAVIGDQSTQNNFEYVVVAV